MKSLFTTPSLLGRAGVGLLMLLFVTQASWAWEGSGTSTDPYLIQSLQGWKDLSYELAHGHSQEGVFFRLNTDLDLEGYSLGDERHPFSGTFDGDGHTLTYNRGGNVEDKFVLVDDYCAPFVRLDGATIQHLKVAGAIHSDHKYAAGIVSMIDGGKPTTLFDCHVSSTLYAGDKVKDDATFGGLVGVVNAGCTADPVIKNCSFTGRITMWASYSSGMVGWSNRPVSFDHCLFDPQETPYVEGCATYVRTAPDVKCTFKECYFTMVMGTLQGEAVFKEVLVPDGCTADIVSEATARFNGEDYWQSGATIELTAPDSIPFDHWYTQAGGCYLNDPWQRSGLQTIRDVHNRPNLGIATSMPDPVTQDRTIDGTVYRYLCRQNYHLYLSDEYIAQKGYQFDKNGELYKNDDGEVWITAVVGWEKGGIPSDGAQIHNDLKTDWKDHTHLAVIAPHAFDGCTELQTLYFKDTDANNYKAKTQFDFMMGEKAFANCPNLTEIKMMQYTTSGSNHWEALRPEQVNHMADNVFEGSVKANFSVDVSLYQGYLQSSVWKKLQNRIMIYNHTASNMEVTGAKYGYWRDTEGNPLKNNSEGNETLMKSLQLWNADYQQFSASSLLSQSDANVWYLQVVGTDEDFLKMHDGVMRIYNDPGSYYNYKTIAITRNALQGSKELKAIEFWQTNGWGENSLDNIKMVIQNGAFYDCPNLKELRMYYYVQDGDDHWEMLGPRDVIPGDNIFGLPTDEQLETMTQEDLLAWPKANPDFHIVVSPMVYDEFINDPNWSKYIGYIVAADYEPTTWSPIEEEGLSYNYACKTASVASTDQAVTQNLSWWNLPIVLFEAISTYNLYQDITFELYENGMAKTFRRFLHQVKDLVKNYSNGWEKVYRDCTEAAMIESTDKTIYTAAIQYNLLKKADNLFYPVGANTDAAIEAGLIHLPPFTHRFRWTDQAAHLLLESSKAPELRKLVAVCMRENVKGWISHSILRPAMENGLRSTLAKVKKWAADFFFQTWH